MKSVPNDTDRSWSTLNGAYYKARGDVGAAVAAFVKKHAAEMGP